jgi:hypothetical protein
MADRHPAGADSSLALRSAHGATCRLTNSPPVSNSRKNQISGGRST